MTTKGYLDMELLRFTTAGNVDDGKSTLIGRLLFDSKSIFEDQLEAVESISKRSGNEEINLALLTDGLRSEREQGITIDVAYRYFATPKRKFIIADTPGHIQYTRNMVTGASTADLAIILVDVRNGVLEQTVRHTFIAALLGIPHVLVCVNKMDMVDFSEKIFREICDSYRNMAAKMEIGEVKFIPISAKYGDNVVTRSPKTAWYDGLTLMETLEQTPITHKLNSSQARMPVQYVIRPMRDMFHDFRAYAGRMAGGRLTVGETVKILPSGLTTKVAKLWQADKEVREISTPDWVSIELEDDIDISRGDMIVGDDGKEPLVSQDITVMICWFNAQTMQLNRKYIISQSTRDTLGMVKRINYKVNMADLSHEENVCELNMNDVASVTIRTAQGLIFDAYKENRITGSLIFIDPDTFETVAAGMIVS